jgi:hypothetical protein
MMHVIVPERRCPDRVNAVLLANGAWAEPTARKAPARA